MNAAWSMKIARDRTPHYAALIMDATENKTGRQQAITESKTGRHPAKTKEAKPENRIGMGFSMHTQKVGAGPNPFTEWVSNLVFWIGHP